MRYKEHKYHINISLIFHNEFEENTEICLEVTTFLQIGLDSDCPSDPLMDSFHTL